VGQSLLAGRQSKVVDTDSLGDRFDDELEGQRHEWLWVMFMNGRVIMYRGAEWRCEGGEKDG
jgi:hypothetical protein